MLPLSPDDSSTWTISNVLLIELMSRSEDTQVTICIIALLTYGISMFFELQISTICVYTYTPSFLHSQMNNPIGFLPVTAFS